MERKIQFLNTIDTVQLLRLQVQQRNKDSQVLSFRVYSFFSSLFLIRDQQVINYTVQCNNTKEEITIEKDDNKSSNSRLSDSVTPD